MRTYFKTTSLANEENDCIEGRMGEPVSPIHLCIQQIFTQGLQALGYVHCAVDLETKKVEF